MGPGTWACVDLCSEGFSTFSPDKCCRALEQASCLSQPAVCCLSATLDAVAGKAGGKAMSEVSASFASWASESASGKRGRLFRWLRAEVRQEVAQIRHAGLILGAPADIMNAKAETWQASWLDCSHTGGIGANRSVASLEDMLA